ncbi:hypothetical protein DESPIG_01493 [Desulfovibrio piger ATCC 29098]|uniref:Uncharacterized protein n=1 Tax=Desulfovibrio piger ATCC 29098 TaxID=411464 RepID=B6WTT6_9BACT|nr:hypothetical protein DESPIG_01493 [Desulfovibrio piger ATCC 29098]
MAADKRPAGDRSRFRCRPASGGISHNGDAFPRTVRAGMENCRRPCQNRFPSRIATNGRHSLSAGNRTTGTDYCH